MTAASQTRVKDVMSTPLETISPDATLATAAAQMREKNINALIVTTGTPSIVTSTDILEAVADGRDTTELTVRDVMTENVETVPPNLGLSEVAAMMENLDINHLPVVDDDYVGMVSSTDLAAQFA